MVDFIITDFSNVRGGGNIVDTVPSAEDFIVDNCTISSSSSGVFVLTPGESLVGTVSLFANKTSITVGESVVFSAFVEDTDGEPLEGLTVSFYRDGVSLGSGVSDDTGLVQLTVSSWGVGSFTCTASCQGVSSSGVTVTVADVPPTPTVSSVSLTADKSILSAYDSESAVLSATVLDGGSNPMSGETVTFYNGSTSMGTATTNSSGIATKSYSSTGAGDVTFKATCESIDSSTITVEDCYYVNTGETSSLTIDSGVTCTVEDGAIKITKSSSGEKFVTCKYSYVSDNHEITFTVPTISSSTNVPLGFAVYTSSTQIYWAGYNKSQGKFDSKSGAKTTSLSAGDTIRITKTGNTLTAYCNGTSISNVTTATSGVRLAFYTNSGYIQYIDDIKVKKT